MEDREYFGLRLRHRNYRRELANIVQKMKILSKRSSEYNQTLARLRFLQSELTELNDRLNDRDRHNHHKVSDHALVRWLERVQGIDIKRLKDHVLIADEEPGFDYVWSDDGALLIVLPPLLCGLVVKN